MAIATAPAITPAKIMEMATGYWVSKTMFTGLELGIFEGLASGSETSDALADLLGLPADTTRRLLTGLASIGLIERAGEGWANSPASQELLVQQSPHYMGGIFGHFSNGLYPLWRHLPDAVREGTDRWSQVFGLKADENPFDAIYSSPVALRGFLETMATMGRESTAALLDSYDFSGHRHLLDVGSALGALPAAVLQQYPHLTATAYDLPPVAPHARAFAVEQGVADRLTVAAGDFLHQPLPAPADVITLGYIIHDWDDRMSLAILRRCYDALDAGGTVIILEKVLNDDRTGPTPAALMDLNMLVATHGRERTFGDYAALLSEAGFTDAEVRILPASRDLVIARKT